MHRLNMELDPQSLFGLHIYCAQLFSLAEPATTPFTRVWGHALLVSQDRRHLFVTSCDYGIGLSYRPASYVAWRGGRLRQPFVKVDFFPPVRDYGLGL
jgi:hypothetical protein